MEVSIIRNKEIITLMNTNFRPKQHLKNEILHLKECSHIFVIQYIYIYIYIYIESRPEEIY